MSGSKPSPKVSENVTAIPATATQKRLDLIKPCNLSVSIFMPPLLYYAFLNNTGFFRDFAGESQFTFQEATSIIGFFCDSNNKEWYYTQGDDAYGNNASNLGVVKDAYSNHVSRTWNANEAQLYLEFDVTDTNDGLDWDESVIKIYASAVYNDGSGNKVKAILVYKNDTDDYKYGKPVATFTGISIGKIVTNSHIMVNNLV